MPRSAPFVPPETPVECKNYAVCGKTFTPTRGNQRFHSPECRDAFWQNRWKEKHVCPLCGNEHSAPSPN